MFWTKVAKALSDIIYVVAAVLALMLAEGLGKVLDSVMAGVIGFMVGIVISLVAGLAMKSLVKSSLSITTVLNRLEGNGMENIIPHSLEEVEMLEQNMKNNENETQAQGGAGVNEKIKNLSTEIKLVWIDVIVMIIGTIYLSYKISEKTQYGAVLVLGFGLVINMLVNAIIGTSVENRHRLERVNRLTKK